jgi:hypothetical protein
MPLRPEWMPPRTAGLGAGEVIFILCFVYGLISENPVESVWAFALLRLMLRLFWWTGYPPILVYALAVPWLEVHVNVFEANYYNVDLNALFPQATGRRTFWIASLGFLAVVLGLRIGLGRIWNRLHPSFEWLKTRAEALNQVNVVVSLVAVRLMTVGLDAIIPWGSSIRQIVTYFSGIELALSVLFTIHFFLTRKRPWLFFLFFLFDVVSSFYSYFGDWKGPIVVLLMGAAMTMRRVNIKQVLAFTPLLAGTIFILFIWQAVKGDYRSFLSKNERAQVVQVSREEALKKFWELGTEALSMSEDERQVVFGATFRRIGYLEFFSGAVDNVPSEIPHERGGLIVENLKFVLIPRLLNPEKGVKNDRLKVEKYTDYSFGENSFSSFSLGHYCEAYIDWGFGGALIQLFCYGLLGAYIVRQVYRRFERLHVLLMFGILFSMLSPWATMQQDFISMFGSILWNTICHFFFFFPVYHYLNRFITASSH